MLEATQHPVNSFWTLTYDDANLPLTEDGLPTLNMKHLTDFMKRLRFDYYPNSLRYFNVGEYGDQTERPHYHLALFNYPACERGVSQLNRRGNCCSVCDRVRAIWSAGAVYSGQLEDASAAYIAGYVTKKLTSKTDPRLKGREKECARMSLKPGIGAGFISEVASVVLTHNLDTTLTDVPTSLQHGATVRPLGRYLTRRLRQEVGKEPNAPASTIKTHQEKLQPLREAARALAPKGLYCETLKQVVIEAHKGQNAKLTARSKIFKKRGSI